MSIYKQQLDLTSLFSEAQLAALHHNREHYNQAGHDPFPVVKLFVPQTHCVWLLTELHNDDVGFGLCDLGLGFPELGYVSLEEVMSVTPNVMVDPNFVAIAPLSAYSEAARNAGHIVETWNGAEVVQSASDPYNIALNDFLIDYRKELLEQIEQQTPVRYTGQHPEWQDAFLDSLKRVPFEAQKQRILACYAALIEHGLPAVYLNGEMGTGKTMMGICVSALMQKAYSQKPVLVISPPHLVYKWRREILDTVPDAVVTVINGSNAVKELIAYREKLVEGRLSHGKPHYLIMGRVRMRMGFYWRAAYLKRRYVFSIETEGKKQFGHYQAVACPSCGAFQMNRENTPMQASADWGTQRREQCQLCKAPLWTMRHKASDDENAEQRLRKFLCKLPGIGQVSADKLICSFGVENLSRIVDDNIHDFVNLCDSEGKFVFTDKHATKLEKALGRLEFALQMLSYQPSEYVKRYFPRKAFSLALIDEAHEYKNASSAQGQAMAVLCHEAEKVLCLTGTLMGGYASDLFYLLFRAMPSEMLKLGFGPNRHNSFAGAEMRFMRDYGCLIDVFKYSSEEGSYKTSKARKMATNVKKAPGFSPMGIAQFVLPYTVFMRLSDLGEGILPPLIEETRMVEMTGKMQECYCVLANKLRQRLDAALRKRDNSLTAVVINALLRWPETCFMAEKVLNPRDKDDVLAQVSPLFSEQEATPKEKDVISLCLAEQSQQRRVIVYTTYTGGYDTSSRLKQMMQQAGLRAAVLRSSVKSDEREDWIADQVERGIDVLICNPELVKTGLDLLGFPTIYFMQTGYNVYTVAQASRRSWRIGQKETVKIYYSCYNGASQVQCLELMAKKIKTALSTMGVMPETGLDVFDEDEDSEASITAALAKTLLK